jgi:DNA gyrase inhibitor GyrI
MKELKVEIIQMPPMRVISARGFGEVPEFIAQEKLLSWAKSKGLLSSETAPRFFGFNNPDPHPGSPNYGYELWMTVDDSVQPEGELEAKQFEGGLYAVADCMDVRTIPQVWQDFMHWLESSPYSMAKHQWLEEHVKFIDLPIEAYQMRLYLPIAEK